MRTFIPLLFLPIIGFATTGLALADDKPSKKQTPAAASQDKEKEEAGKKKVDRYAVPEGDVAELLEFIDRVKSFQPRKFEEHLEHRQKSLGAIKLAAERILKLEKDSANPAAQKAMALLLEFRIRDLPQASRKQQGEALEAVHQYLTGLDKLSVNALQLAYSTASAIERAGNTDLAAQAYGKFGEMFSGQHDEALASYGKVMLGAGRRVNLLGNEMEISGMTLDGDTFDWSAYRGKVVLVDFWATWCGPCVAELPNVKKSYEQYHDRGFEVVGISLDTNRDLLARFVEERELPWVTLFEEGRGGQHPVATYYGVMAIPTVMLVDREGKVVSLNARGPELERQLEQLFGASSAESGGE